MPDSIEGENKSNITMINKQIFDNDDREKELVPDTKMIVNKIKVMISHLKLSNIP